ncbi:MAG TPA: L,D-transpeptidase [Mycobacteriales bacterium]|nr:L,D-transpeptidase [Mycobacteriales bacterium]
MTLFDRFRARRDDPYRGYYATGGRWSARIALALPLAVVTVLVVSVALAAVRPNAQGAPRSRHAGGLGYQSLLIPTDAAAPTFQVGHNRAVQSAQRVVMAYNGGADQRAALAAPRTRSASGRSDGSYRVDEHGYRIAPSKDSVLVPATTVVAHLEHSTKGYPAANAFSSNRTVPGSWYGYPSILPVIDSTQDRLKVMLAQRPDNSTSWIKRSAAVLSRIHYAIVVDISQHWLYLFYKGNQIASYPVGTGASGTPTPTGNYFIAFHAPPNGPGYGSVMLETSAHSRVISHFEGGDDAIIAIHGPVGSDAQIGNHGAAISNGCIRMHDADLRQVKHVRNGSPVFLTY